MCSENIHHILGIFYRLLEKILRILVLLLIYPIFLFIAILRSPKQVGHDVVIVQFAPRAGYIGGDVVANSLIREALEIAGFTVDTFSAYSDGRAKGILAWIWGGKWLINRTISKRLKKSSASIIIDAQLNLGLLPNRCINICHYSFRGYRKLAGIGWSMGERLSNVIDSLIQSIGSLRSLNVAVSNFQRHYLVSEGVHVDLVIPNSVDLSVFSPDDSVKKTGKYLFLGGYSRYGKGFDVLERLAERGLEIACASNCKPVEPLIFLGSISHKDIPRVLKEHLVLIHPSRYESCSMSILEAMATGLPVLISNVGIGPELRKEIPEFVVDGFNDNAIEEYVRKGEIILNDYYRFSVLSRKYVEKKHSLIRFKQDWNDLVLRLR